MHDPRLDLPALVLHRLDTGCLGQVQSWTTVPEYQLFQQFEILNFLKFEVSVELLHVLFPIVGVLMKVEMYFHQLDRDFLPKVG